MIIFVQVQKAALLITSGKIVKTAYNETTGLFLIESGNGNILSRALTIGEEIVIDNYIWNSRGKGNWFSRVLVFATEKHAGLLHDVLEDTDATEADVLDFAGPDILEAVKLVTKTDGYDENEYIEAILKNDIAKEVKNADRIHNLREARTAGIDFIQRYIRDTEDNYKGRFSAEMDHELDSLKEELERCTEAL